jgi:CRISPR/Cas system CSM-associated protein Csm3 (group 7 of RAMP superfamily)
MKKIDLHIHTIQTISDSPFTFDLEKFKWYVTEAKLDAVAVTNHDRFDADQFKVIQEALDIPVFPGIEINLGKGHILIICEASNLASFVLKTDEVAKRITKIGDNISVKELQDIFGDLHDYLVIPHYDKDPPISAKDLEEIKDYVAAGEVDSAKKFIRVLKDDAKLTPVLFSDVRIRDSLSKLPNRQTYIDCGELSLTAIKECLRKGKVALSERDGNKLWPIFENGQHISTGLNILLGERSSGKTYTLNKINDSVQCVKYIEQFSLVQQDEYEYEKEFNDDINRKRSAFIDEYLLDFKKVVEEICNVDLHLDQRKLEDYVSSLLRSGEDADRRDAFSKTTLFAEVDFPIGQLKTLHDLIESVRQVIENIEFKGIIEKHIEVNSLKGLIRELIEIYWEKEFDAKKKKWVNQVVNNIKQSLKMRTSAVQVPDIDLYQVAINKIKVKRFQEIVNFLKNESVISEENIQGFRIEAKKEKFNGAMEMQKVSGKKVAFSEAFKSYDHPYEFLQKLLLIDLPRSDLYKFFVKINYRILNRDGYEVSGGERSEFRLLQEIANAQKYDILLIDEPESSFDNIFLKSDVNQIIKEISKSMPVVVVTHNSTVGASVGADYYLYAKKELENGQVVYRLYSGHPSDTKLYSTDGKSINTHDVLMNSLEAGFEAYNERRKSYEAIKN